VLDGRHGRFLHRPVVSAHAFSLANGKPMTATVAPKRIGKFEFRVAVSEKKTDAEQRAAAMTTWLLAQWKRKVALHEEEPFENPVNASSRCIDLH